MAPTQALALIPEEAETLRAQSNVLLERAKAITITDAESYQLAAAELRKQNDLYKQVRGIFDRPKKAADAAHKAVCAAEKTVLWGPEQGIAILKRKMADWQMREEQQRRIAEAKAQAEAKARQDAAALAEAEELQAAGDQAGAERVIAEAAVAPAPVIEIARTVAEGVSTRRSWTWRPKQEQVDACPTCGHDRNGTKPEYLIRDESKIGKLVRALGKDAERVVGGIDVIEDRSVAVRSAV